jgi:hypothetical protein
MVDIDGIEGDVDAHNTVFGGQAKMTREIHHNKFGKHIVIYLGEGISSEFLQVGALIQWSLRCIDHVYHT